MTKSLTIKDLMPIDGDKEPRVKDTTLGRALGMAAPRNIRQVIESNADELGGFGLVHAVRAPIKNGKGRIQEVTEYYLNEPQAILISILSRAPQAAVVRKGLIDLYMAYRSGQLVRVKSHMRNTLPGIPATPRKPSKFNPEQCKQIGGIVKTAFESYHKKLEDAFGSQLSLPMKSDKGSCLDVIMPVDEADKVIKTREMTMEQIRNWLMRISGGVDSAIKAKGNTKEMQAIGMIMKFAAGALNRSQDVNNHAMFILEILDEQIRKGQVKSVDRNFKTLHFLHKSTLNSGIEMAR